MKRGVSGVDRLFSHDDARMAFLKFSRYLIEKGEEATILLHFAVDPIFIDAISTMKIELDRSVNYIDGTDLVEYEMCL